MLMEESENPAITEVKLRASGLSHQYSILEIKCLCSIVVVVLLLLAEVGCIVQVHVSDILVCVSYVCVYTLVHTSV